MLLLPFRLSPVLCTEGGEDDIGIYYGLKTRSEDPESEDPETLDPPRPGNATWNLFCEPATWEYFERRTAELPPYRHVRIGEDRVPVLFGCGGDLSFDPVASAFYFLSGWQELVTRQRDDHGRFQYENSIQNELEIRLTPVVEWYRHVSADALRKRGFTVERKQYSGHEWAFCSTHDVDYVRKWRPGIYKREILDRVVLNREKEAKSDRIHRLMDATWSLIHSGDPFRDAIHRIQKELDSRGATGTFFYKTAAHGHRDVSYDLHETHVLTALSEQMSAGHEIGLHPSYHSFAHEERLRQEKSNLKRAIHRDVKVHRAHYLRFDLPRSIDFLQKGGFQIDSTLGFAECAGFRFGTCLPFPLFDTENGCETGVWELPLCMMESALFNRQHLSSVEAERETNKLIQTCSSFGGVFVGLWHTTLWDERDYPGWGAHFLSSLDEAARFGATFDSLSGVLESWK